MLVENVEARMIGRGYRVTWPKKLPVRRQTVTLKIGDEELTLLVSNDVARAIDSGECVNIVITVQQ